MSNNQWIDIPGGFGEAQVNPRSGTSCYGDHGETMTSSSSDNILRLNDSCTQEYGRCQVSAAAERKKKASRIVGWGLRRFSTIVCDKVQAKGRTTYNEVADEIIAEASWEKDAASLFAFDEKNIRRRVYDAFNVLMAINVIAKDKKEIRWIGFPTSKTEESTKIEEVRMNLTNRIQAKASYLQELDDRLVDLQNLMLRNQLRNSGNISSDGVALPFVLVRTHPKATVEIEISEDTRLVHFDFNGAPFSLYDDPAILKMMRRPSGRP